MRNKVFVVSCVFRPAPKPSLFPNFNAVTNLIIPSPPSSTLLFLQPPLTNPNFLKCTLGTVPATTNPSANNTPHSLTLNSPLT